ncbi:AAA family ATPase [Ruania alba]|nr:AAA family ATPase [Ruania alba]
MRDDEIRQKLVSSNPWWAAASLGKDATAWSTRHPALKGLASYDVGYRAPVLDDVATGPVTDRLVVLTGPRRIGKSVAVLQTVASLCARDDIDPRQVIHVPCDGMNLRDLRRVLVVARAQTAAIDRDELRLRVWLFDEITSIRGWSALFKGERDNTDFGFDTVVVTGSRWDKTEDITGNLIAGRSGSETRRRRMLLPMSFREFLGVSRYDLPQPAAGHPASLQSQEARRSLEELSFLVDDYDLAWQDYMSVGGFPRAVSEHIRNGLVSDQYLQDLEGWLQRDVDPDAGEESIPLLLEALATRATSPLAVNPTAIELGRSREALDTRLHRMVASFAVLRCPQRDDHGRLVPRTQSKHYLVDPLLAWMPSRLRAGALPPAMTALTEQTIGVHLARAIERLGNGRWIAGDTIGYGRTSNDKEIDLTPVSLPSPDGTVMSVALESKWVSQGWRGEGRILTGKYGRGILATKSVLDVSGPVWAVPAPMLALMLV